MLRGKVSVVMDDMIDTAAHPPSRDYQVVCFKK
uniref:Uncharacterized protein n=1 Tax=Triticum urartu TaxID=4572 RepID=A0A8R7TNQ1_TRIUA